MPGAVGRRQAARPHQHQEGQLHGPLPGELELAASQGTQQRIEPTKPAREHVTAINCEIQTWQSAADFSNTLQVASLAHPRSPMTAAPRLHPLQLLLPACVHFSCCSLFASASTAPRLRLLQLLLPDCICLF